MTTHVIEDSSLRHQLVNLKDRKGRSPIYQLTIRDNLKEKRGGMGGP